ncbi:hypothetical protein PF005_g6604 [Phytophthora fragariae]|uniref:MalT-like TPR region domain-containing protein n=1 Tax=Phytophthora fragariae TaxID=53985 RepID=A0A6A3FHV7_9STRA|nr:hypothetical protein PF003_g38631 [Phytophthora fragariae]KAE8944733.1 hypothetical protein PF009_g5591 [Phytophthora fragariae]KAE9019139.1 hypothetical protein PF011_g5958 [Phytophthora fragariae]KAE9123306.1 hypothetical protein PF010_g6450 [Phytophthora fragariae]KAE9128453.1 hypothetical protein PF007_g5248 [Phytophthora fragariae]
MERARIRRRRQQFQAQLEIQTRELRDALAAQLSNGAKNASVHTRLVLKLQYQLGEQCAEYDEFGLASMYFQQVLTGVDASHSNGDQAKEVDEQAVELAALRTNTLNWLAVTHFRSGNQSEAMEFLLQAKKLTRGDSTPTESLSIPVDKSLTANYAIFLHAKGNIADAESAAHLVVNEGESDPTEETEDDTRARSTAFMLLASIFKARGDSERALKNAERAVALADRVQDPRLISRAHNNLGIYCLEQSDVERAFNLFTSAYRATLQTKDFQQQSTVKYHLGIALSYLGRNLNGKQEIGEDEEDEDTPAEVQPKQEQEHSTSPENSEALEIESDVSPAVDANAEAEPATEALTPAATVAASSPTKAPKDLFLESENLTAALPEPDNYLRVLAQGCRGEEEYYAGEFHTAEAEFAIALGQLKEFTGIDLEDNQNSDAVAKDTDSPIESEDVAKHADGQEEEELALPPIEPELAKLHGLLLCYTGCTQLVEGKFTLAEHSHKRDLALALRQEDLHAQHRALRNLAIAYNATQRYTEAIPLWREALELAVVLDFKGEQLMAYSGLGSALRELLMLEGPGAAAIAGLNSSSGPMQPLQVFLKQRALAEQIGDLHQQILAQRHIVSVYESPISKPQSDGEATEALERRLSECDVLVRLCENYENLQFRADAYRSLANALTSQLARLRARANGDGTSPPQYGLADAIAVLSQKRNSVCASYQEANVALSTAAALMFQDVYEEGIDDDEKVPKPKPEERHARPPLTRLEILHRR